MLECLICYRLNVTCGLYNYRRFLTCIVTRSDKVKINFVFKKAKPLKKPDDTEHAYNYALFLLDLRLRTEGEMRDKMQQRGYYPEVIDKIINQLIEEKLIDDNRYAEIYIDNMLSYKQYGYYMMKKKLVLKKLPKDLIENYLNDLVTEEEEKKVAKRYVEKEFGTTAEIKKLPYEEKQKIMRRLLSRGFRVNVATSLVK